MTSFTPKKNFLICQPVACANLQERREDTWLTVSMTYALAEMTHLGATTEQLNGARNFIHVLQNLWDKGQENKRLPVSRLESYDEDVTQLVKKKDNK